MGKVLSHSISQSQCIYQVDYRYVELDEVHNRKEVVSGLWLNQSDKPRQESHEVENQVK